MDDDKIRKESQAAKDLLAKQTAQAPGKAPEAKAPEAVAAPVPAAPAQSLNTSANAEGGTVENEVEKLKAELQKHKVEEGRLKKASEELARLREEREALKKRLDELEMRNRADKAVERVDPERRKVIDEDVLKGAADVAYGVSEELEQRIAAKLAELEQKVEQTSRARLEADSRAFDLLIEQGHPGFIASTNAGGQLVDAWERFLGKTDPATGLTYEKSLQSAYMQRRLDGVNRVIDLFLDESGVARRSAVGETLAPSASATVTDGPSGAGDKTVYTMSEVKQILAQSRTDYERGRIDGKQRNEIVRKIQTAISEGRIVRDTGARVY